MFRWERGLLAFLVKLQVGFQIINLRFTDPSCETLITRQLFENVITQNKDFRFDSEKTKTIKNELKTRKISNYNIK